VINRRRRIGILTSNGEVWWPVRQDIQFVIPSVAPTDLVQRCGNLEECVPSNRTEIQARIEVLKRLREVERVMDRAYHATLQKSVKTYDLVKSPDPMKWSQVSVMDVARLHHRNPDIYAIFATHKYMMSNPAHFVASHSYETTQMFNVRPQSQIDEIQTVQSWSRIHDGPIASFAEKARKVMEFNQATHAKSRGENPRQSLATHAWSPEDKVILCFLQHSLRQTRSSQSDPYSLGRSTILKALNPKGPLIDDETVRQALVDLGVFAPWQDLVSLSPDLVLDHELKVGVEAQDIAVLKSLSAPCKSTPLGPEDFHPSDPLEALRHDFGDLPVFVIDEATAEELDDGISIEKIPAEPGHLWAHIHVADPAAVIPPTHVLAQQARRQNSTAYFIQRSWPLFPRHDPVHNLSLGSKLDHPKQVLTFSAKVNNMGEIIDFKVRAAIVRNIHVVTYDDVDAALGIPAPPAWYPYGKQCLGPRPSLRTLTDGQAQDLRALYEVSESFVAKRQREGVFVLGQPKVDIRNVIRPPADLRSPTLEPSAFKGFPTFEYRVMDLEHLDSGAHSMVAELMKVASRVASRFCLEHNVPALRRVSNFSQGDLSVDLGTVLNMRSRNGYVSFDQAAQYLRVGSTASYVLEPLGHFGLGVPAGEGYIRATSPLRRYLDLVHHWQIHHALLGSTASSRTPPFDSAHLGELAISVGSSERLERMTQRNHKKFWQIMLLKRWADDTAQGVEREHDPLQNLVATTLGKPSLHSLTRKLHVEVHIRSLGMGAMLENLDNPELPIGSEIPVKVLMARLGVRPHLEVVQKIY